jgi:DNA-binding transcriptional MerR regulator
MSETRYIISDAAKMIDVEPHVLRYWEEELGMEIPRNEMGHRYYTDKEVRLFTMVRDLKDKGFQLKAIKMILSAIDSEENSNKIISLDEIRKNYENAQKQENEDTPKNNSANPDIQLKDNGQSKINSGTAKNVSTMEFSQNTASKTSDGNQSKLTERGEMIQSKSQSDTAQQTVVGEDQENHEETGLLASRMSGDVSVPLTSEEKMAHFKYMMDSIVMQALKKNNQTLEKQISDQISERLISEMDMLLKLQEEREEERYRNIDEMIRQRQQGYREAAAAKAPAFSSKKEKKKWFKNREF